MSNTKGIIYILKNESMPGWIKIGVTARTLKKRMKELYTTAVPMSFDCVYACEVENFEKAEKIEEDLLYSFEKFRLNLRREYFKDLEPERLIRLLKHFSIREVTDMVNSQIEEAVPVEERAADSAAKIETHQRRLRLNFETLGIMAGERLHYVDDASVTVEIISDRLISFRGEAQSLTKATKTIKGERGEYNIHISGTPSWVYKGRQLDEICDEKLRMQPLDE